MGNGGRSIKEDLFRFDQQREQYGAVGQRCDRVLPRSEC